MIAKLLVANRAEIASRIFRTARAMDIATVAVFSDADAGLPYVCEADESVRLPGSTPAETYLRGDAIIAAALATGADAVHPGYGFLSENAAFARACADADLTFVGPTPDAIDAMGSKIAAKELMRAAGVPVLPGFTVTDDDAPAIRAAAQQIGYPVLVKAVFGGGGRGMRIVNGPDEVLEAIAGARREAASAFGDGTVFLERFVTAPRHIEVQIVGDAAGEVAHLFERECSIQRRYQKIIEEAPAPGVDDDLRARLCTAAVAAGKAIGYVGAGTVEFVLDQSGDFYFLEVNTRLQVEHPVTEMVTGLDLVEIQLRIAAGAPIADEVRTATVTGHAIEARLYAEDVPAGYLPTSGDIHTFEIPPSLGLRIDAGFAAGTRVSTFYDSMLAKVIAHGPDRDTARRRLAGALSRGRIHGVVTNRDLLVSILRERVFAAGRYDTGYLDRGLHDTRDRIHPAHLIAAAIALQAQRRADAPVLAGFPSGWRNNRTAMQQVSFTVGDDTHDIGYQIAGGEFTATISGVEIRGSVHAASPVEVDIEYHGVRRLIGITTIGHVSYVDSALGHDALRIVPRFADPAATVTAGSLLAPMPGTVVRVNAAAGDHVKAGQALVAIEAMKMEHTISAPVDGIVSEMRVTVGQQVDTGAVVAVLGD